MHVQCHSTMLYAYQNTTEEIVVPKIALYPIWLAHLANWNFSKLKKAVMSRNSVEMIDQCRHRPWVLASRLSPSPARVFLTLLIWQGPNTDQTVFEVNQEHTGHNERLYACVCEYKQNYCLESSCSSHWRLYWSQRKWHFLIWGALGKTILTATAETTRIPK